MTFALPSLHVILALLGEDTVLECLSVYVVTTTQAAERSRVIRTHDLAKKHMASWLVGQKLPAPRQIPFQKTAAEVARLERMGSVLLKLLPASASLCISPKDAQEYFALTAKVHCALMLMLIDGLQRS